MSEIVVVTKGSKAGEVGRVVSRSTDGSVVAVTLASGEPHNFAADALEAVEQTTPYTSPWSVRAYPEGVFVQQGDVAAVAEVTAVEHAHLLAAAPVLLDLVEKLARVVSGFAGSSPIVTEAENMVAFLRRKHDRCRFCPEEGTCSACNGTGVIVGAREVR